MSEELKVAQEELASSVKTLVEAIGEAKTQFTGAVPADVNKKLEQIATEVTDLSAAVKKLDEAPVLRRAFEVEGREAKTRTDFERKMRLPSRASGDEEMKDIFELQDALEVLRFVKRHDPLWRPEQSQTHARLKEAIERKAAYDGTATHGAEWIPTGYSPDLVMLFELQRQVAGLFTMIQMPNDPFKIPTQTGAATAYIKTRAVNATESESLTGDVTLTCKTIAAYSRVAYEVEEDAIIAMLPFIRQDLAMALASGEENAILNGDTTGTHQDSDVTATEDVRKSWKGLRKLAMAQAGMNYDINGVLTTAKLRYLRALAGKYGVNPAQNAWIVSPIGLVEMLMLTEVLTVDKFGPQATVKAGQVGNFDGCPVIVSGFMREDLNASAVYDGSTTDNTAVLYVNTSGFVLGRRRAPMIESFRDVVAGADEIVASMREDFQMRYPVTEPLVVCGKNVTDTIAVS